MHLWILPKGLSLHDWTVQCNSTMACYAWYKKSPLLVLIRVAQRPTPSSSPMHCRHEASLCHHFPLNPSTCLSTQREILFQAQQLKCLALLTSVIVVLQEKYQVQEQQAASVQASLVLLQTANSDLKAKHDSSVAAQAAAEQRLTHSTSELRALQTEHATQQAELASVSAERDRMTQAGVSHAAELSQMQRGLSTCQVQLENSKELQRQSQEKLTAHEAGLTQLQQQYYQTGRQLSERPTPLHKQYQFLCKCHLWYGLVSAVCILAQHQICEEVTRKKYTSVPSSVLQASKPAFQACSF